MRQAIHDISPSRSGSAFTALVVLLVLAAFGFTSIASAQDRGAAGGNPEELWKEFPLDDPVETPAVGEGEAGSGADRTSTATSTPKPSATAAAVTGDEGDGDGTGVLPFLLGLAVLAIGAAALLRLRASRDAGPATREEPHPGVASQAGGDSPQPPTVDTGAPGAAPAGLAGSPGWVAGGARHEPQDPSTLPPAGTSVFAYVTDLAPVAGPPETPDLAEQEAIVRTACRRRRWHLLDVITEDGADRSRLEAAVGRLETGEASAIVVSHLDRVATSASELGPLLDRIDGADATLVSLDYGLSTASPSGALLVKVLSGVAAWEARAGEPPAQSGGDNDVESSRSWDEPAVRARIGEMRSAGMTLQAIADALNAENVPTLRGGKVWGASGVRAAIRHERPPKESGLHARRR